MKRAYEATVSGAALIAGTIGALAAMPAAAQDAPAPRRITLARPTPTPSPTPTATPTPAAAGPTRRVILSRPVTPAAQPAPPATGGRPAPVASPAAAGGRPAPVAAGGRPAPVQSQTAQPQTATPAAPQPRAPIQIRRPSSSPAVAQPSPATPSQVAAPSGPVRFNVDPKPTLAELSRIDPIASGQVRVKGAVTLRDPTYADLMKSVSVTRKFNLTQLRANPRITLNAGKLDLTPVLTRKGALPVVAQQLRARPNLATVNVEDVEVSELRQGGLIVRSFLNYQLKLGACSGSNRGQVEAMGVHCVRRLGTSDAQLAASFADPKDVHYVADPTERARIVAQARINSKLQREDVAKEVANFRASLGGGTGRQALTGQIGAGEVARLSAMNDDDLAAELINSAENKIEQVAFVPAAETIDLIPKGLLGGLMIKLPPKPPAPPPPPQKVETSTPITEQKYLTGFTLGKSYEWSYKVEKTIKWCLIGCKKKYYAKAYARLSYGFGLRFPIRLGGTYDYAGEVTSTGKSQNGAASYTAQFAPFDGSPDDYRATGLPENKLFNGKELVAEAWAGAGFSAHIPVYPDPPDIDISVGKDFTELLPAPFAGGNLTPPPAGQTESGNFIFSQFDLLGGRLNFGVVGAQVFPAVKIGLHSDNLSFRLTDELSGATTMLTHPGQKVPLKVDGNQVSKFKIDQPLYNVGFVITPGIDARLFVDIGVWGKTWDFPLFFPELTIEIPKGGVDFACHDGTICARNWEFATIGGKTSGGAAATMLADSEGWGPGFQEKWLPQCVDETCRIGIRFQTLGTQLKFKELLGVTDYNNEAQIAATKGQIASLKGKSEMVASIMVKESQARKTAAAADAWSILAQAVRTKECKEMDCPPEIAAIAKTMAPRAKQLQLQNPTLSSLNITGMVSKEVAPKFQAAIDRSIARYGVDSIGVLAEAVWVKQCIDKTCTTNVKLLVGKMSAEARAIQKGQPDLSALELNKAVGPKYGKLFQKEIDAAKARADSVQKMKATGGGGAKAITGAKPGAAGAKPIKP